MVIYELTTCWFAATEEAFDELFVDAVNMNAQAYADLPKADRTVLGAVAEASPSSEIYRLFLSPSGKLGRPFLKGDEILIYRIPDKATKALAARTRDADALAAEWTKRLAEVHGNDSIVIPGEAAAALAELAAKSVTLDAWLWVVINIGDH